MFAFAPLLAFGSLWCVPFLWQVDRKNIDKALAGVLASCFWPALRLAHRQAGPSLMHIPRENGQSCIGAFHRCNNYRSRDTWRGILPYTRGIDPFIVGGLSSGPAIVDLFIVGEHVGQVEGTALAIVNMGGLASGALWQPIVGKLLDLGWQGDFEIMPLSNDVQGESRARIWPAHHMRAVMSGVLLACYACAATICVFLFPKSSLEVDEDKANKSVPHVGASRHHHPPEPLRILRL